MLTCILPLKGHRTPLDETNLGGGGRRGGSGGWGSDVGSSSSKNSTWPVKNEKARLSAGMSVFLSFFLSLGEKTPPDHIKV